MLRRHNFEMSPNFEMSQNWDPVLDFWDKKRKYVEIFR